ncbi:MAG TPA: DNA-formamidopyrimidine glycosylase family protein [Microbacterium sp.]|nr:DNA-formamidopyrimidine glycosylase family protein [Microbacterium sp.]
MPEAPEVSELAAFLTARTAGRRIRAFDVAIAKIVKTNEQQPGALEGCRITGVARIAKMIDVAMVDTGGAEWHVIVHFGHDGWVVWHDTVPDGMARTGEATLMARVRLDDGAGFDLTDAGQWKSLTVHIVPRASDVPAVAKLGPDPLGAGFDETRFAAILAGRKKQIKALLQDQGALAGIGNAYSDEILHAARISPVAHAASLTDDEVARLFDAMETTLHESSEARRGIPPADLKAAKHAALRVHRRTGETCPVCGDVIRELTFSGAAAQYCATCQTGGVPLK